MYIFFSKIEVLFYEGKIRVNEEKLKKKSDMVRDCNYSELLPKFNNWHLLRDNNGIMLLSCSDVVSCHIQVGKYFI